MSAPTMTLRDEFAACALQGMLANPGTEMSGSWQDSPASLVATHAYAYADAMLIAREATETAVTA